MPKRRALALALLLAALPAAPTPAQPRPEVAGAAAVRAKVQREGRARVLVELARPPGKAGAAPEAPATPASALGGKARPLGSLPFAALEVDARELEALLASGVVRRVGENRKVRPSLHESVPLVGGRRAWALGGRGAGQHVVVVDTGVRSSHPFLAGKVARSLCAAPDCGGAVVERAGAGEPHPSCPRGSLAADHGTHVAGIAAGRGGGFSGVAPDAKLISIRVFTCEEADWEHVLRALDHVATALAPAHRIAAVNLSLGDGSFFGSACDEADAAYAALALVVGKLRRLGVATVASSGNEATKTGISAPSCIEEAIAVGSTAKDDTASWFSNSAPNLDLLAPGDGIYSSLASGGFGHMDGTSMAAPHVSGAIAAIRSAVPGAAVAEIEEALERTGKLVRDPGNGLRKPRLDVARALASLQAPAVARWHGWETFGGRLAGGPECLAGGSARTDCVAPLAGALAWWRFEEGRETRPIPLGGGDASAASCARAGGELHCFVATAQGRLAQRTLRAGRWLPWRDLGGDARRRPACLSVDDRRLGCVALGGDGRLRWRGFDGRAWAAWRLADAGLVARTVPVCHAETGAVGCVVAGADGAAFHLRLGPDGRWTTRRLGGSVREAGSCVLTGTDRRACFFLGASGSLRRIVHERGAWGGWADLGGALAGAPACLRLGVAGVTCLAPAGDGTLRERRFDGSEWLAWRSLRGALKPDRLACVAPNRSRIDCFAHGGDGALARISYR